MPRTIVVIMDAAVTVGYGMTAFFQWRSKPKSKKWPLSAAVSVVFLVLAIGHFFGFEI
jgi:hypothetical protein